MQCPWCEATDSDTPIAYGMPSPETRDEAVSGALSQALPMLSSFAMSGPASSLSSVAPSD